MLVETLQVDAPSQSADSQFAAVCKSSSGRPAAKTKPAAAVCRPACVDENRIEQLLRRRQRWRYTRWPSSEALPVERRQSLFAIDVQAAQQRKTPPSRLAVAGRTLRAGRIWLVSTLAHVLLLALLAAWSIRSGPPPDTLILFGDVEPSSTAPQPLAVQIAVPSAAAPQARPLEAFALPDSDDLAGQLAALPRLDSAPRGSGPVGEVRALFGRHGAGLASEGAGSGGAEFFGVNASGDKFVFVVDCSRSMTGQKWRMACAELASAIGRLGDDKFFYVVLFDGEMHPMYTPHSSEPMLIAATAENIQHFRDWLATVRLGYFTKPLPAVMLALELQPDAIYLLSDGEFSDSTASHLRRHNKIDDNGVLKMPAVVVHTIGFYSRDGQRTLRQIAERNGGRYKFVSIPGADELSSK